MPFPISHFQFFICSTAHAAGAHTFSFEKVCKANLAAAGFTKLALPQSVGLTRFGCCSSSHKNYVFVGALYVPLWNPPGGNKSFVRSLTLLSVYDSASSLNLNCACVQRPLNAPALLFLCGVSRAAYDRPLFNSFFNSPN